MKTHIHSIFQISSVFLGYICKRNGAEEQWNMGMLISALHADSMQNICTDIIN